MDFRLRPEEEKYRMKMRTWLGKTFPKDQPPPKTDTPEEAIAAYKAYQKKLFEGGYAGIMYPKKYGGQEGTMIQELVVREELTPYDEDHEAIINAIGMGMALPTINAVGTKEQKEMFIRKLLDGTHIWVQAFSEPNAGSDVAAITTRAENKGDHYIVNGQKIWVSNAHYADWALLLVRTNPDRPKHKGLSYLLVDLKSAGVLVRPIKQITGESEFNEIYFDDVKVPTNMLVGQEGSGWNIALTTLMFERTVGDLTVFNMLKRLFNDLLNMASGMKRDGKPVLEDLSIRQKIAKCYSDLLVLKYTGLRNFSKVATGGIPGPEGSIGKLIWSMLQIEMTELSMEIQGPYSQLMKGSPYVIAEGLFQHSFLVAKGNAIAAGSTEVMKNIIGERVLGLPKDVAREIIAGKELS